jgi:tetratricopeptide (TPR) repeat protein
MHTGRRILFSFFWAALCTLALTSSAAAQTNQDNQPHVTPRKSPPEPTPQSAPLQQRQQPTQASPEAQQQGESSSTDSQIDFNAAPRAKDPGPAISVDEGTFRPWDPHRAAKDVEVGNYYLRLKNYRAALDRFNDALVYKPKDAEATYGLAVTQEKLDLLSQAYQNYREYLKIMDSGPHAKESQDAIKRIGPHLDIRNDPKRQAEHDINVGETYLSMNKYDAARDRFQEALLLEPENPVACFRLAQSLKGLQQLDPSRLFYQKYLDLAPHGQFASDAKKAIADINATIGK